MENFRIESLEINKIGAFEHLKMDFPKKKDPEKAEIHILTGENGTGKTTVLEALVESIIPITHDRHVGFHKKSHYSEGVFEVKFENYLPSRFMYHGGYFPPVSSIPLFISDYQNTYSPFHLSAVNTPLHKLYTAFFAYSGYRKVSGVQIIGPKQILDNPLKDSLDFNNSINPENLMQWIVNTVMAELSSKGRGDVEKAKLFKKSLEKLEEILSKITSKQISFDIDDDWNVKLKEEFILFFDVLPDGLKSMISWLGDLLMRMDRLKWENDVDIFDRNFILFLDEIEVHLHPAWQRKILPVVQKLFKNAQIFISTHSPFVVGSVDGAWVHKFKKDGAYAVLDGEPILSEDAESYDTILEEVFGITRRFGDPIEDLLVEFRVITREILKGNESNLNRWNEIISIFAKQERPDEIMSVIKPIRNQINRIRNQVEAIY